MFSCDLQALEFDRFDAVTYRLGDILRSCNFLQFARDLGLYTRAEIEDPLLLTHLQTARLLEDEGFIEFEFWTQVGRGPFAAEITVSRLRDPLDRFLARLIISYLQHRATADKLNRRDLYFLWCFHQGHPLTFTRLLATQLMTRGAALRGNSFIPGGHLVTVLARAHQVDLIGLTSMRPRPFSASDMRRRGLVERVGSGFALPAAAPPQAPPAADLVAPPPSGAGDPEVVFQDAPLPPQRSRVSLTQVVEQLDQVRAEVADIHRQMTVDFGLLRGTMGTLFEGLDLPIPPHLAPPQQPP